MPADPIAIKTPARLRGLIVLLCAALLLGGCGIKGDLYLPRPAAQQQQ